MYCSLFACNLKIVRLKQCLSFRDLIETNVKQDLEYKKEQLVMWSNNRKDI